MYRHYTREFCMSHATWLLIVHYAVQMLTDWTVYMYKHAAT